MYTFEKSEIVNLLKIIRELPIDTRKTFLCMLYGARMILGE